MKRLRNDVYMADYKPHKGKERSIDLDKILMGFILLAFVGLVLFLEFYG